MQMRSHRKKRADIGLSGFKEHQNQSSETYVITKETLLVPCVPVLSDSRMSVRDFHPFEVYIHGLLILILHFSNSINLKNLHRQTCSQILIQTNTDKHIQQLDFNQTCRNVCLLHRNCDNTGATKWRWKIRVSIHTRVSRNFIKEKYGWDNILSDIMYLRYWTQLNG